MLLAIDIGNSHIVCGVFDDEKLVCEFRIATQSHKTADEYGILIKNIMESRKISAQKIKGAIISSVVPPFIGVFEEMIQNYFSIIPIIVTNKLLTGISISYDRPEEIGADRIVNAAAAYHQFGGPVIIIDFGTATTFCVVSEKGHYLGGAIAPGLIISSEALFSYTAKLPRIEWIVPESVIGKNTQSGMQSGLIFGHVGMVNEIITLISKEINAIPHVIATGGLSHFIAPLCKVVSIVKPTLTLEGLLLIYSLNRRNKL
ncbi:MAG: type III pantothenate kinase [Nitrospirae bacterium]|nr:type III pantothenate kinase [Candidatus Troglogloeales bacterium]MBI3598955.1 type III pantothenate kinase [Candidatus Troglogloeales bacterium]